jgi:hypothetical protein
LRLRNQWAKRIAAGEAIKCCRCGKPVLPQQKWHLGHRDEIGSHAAGRYLGVSHQRCNVGARNSRIAKLAKQAQEQQAETPRPTREVPAAFLAVFGDSPESRAVFLDDSVHYLHGYGPDSPPANHPPM